MLQKPVSLPEDMCEKLAKRCLLLGQLSLRQLMLLPRLFEPQVVPHPRSSSIAYAAALTRTRCSVKSTVVGPTCTTEW